MISSINWSEILRSAPGADLYPEIFEHSKAVADYVHELCLQLCAPDEVRNRAVALAWLHDAGKAQWLEQEGIAGTNRATENELALQYLKTLDLLTSEALSEVVRLLGYLDLDILLGCQFISLPAEPKLVFWADLHCNGNQRVSLDTRKDYLYERYFDKTSRESEFSVFWEKRLEFSHRFEVWVQSLKDANRARALELEHVRLSDFLGGWLYPGEPETLARFSELTAEIEAPACEVGSWRGRSSVCIAGARAKSKNSKLYCVDDWQGGTDADCKRLAKNFDIFGEFKSNTSRYSKHIHPLLGLSNQMTDHLPERFAFVFLDGDHSQVAVSWECDFFAPRIMIGGVLAFHDCDNPNYPAVRVAVNALIESGSWEFIGQTNYLCGLRRTR